MGTLKDILKSLEENPQEAEEFFQEFDRIEDDEEIDKALIVHRETLRKNQRSLSCVPRLPQRIGAYGSN